MKNHGTALTEEIRNLLAKRLTQLDEYAKILAGRGIMPEGSLRICTRNDRPYFYAQRDGVPSYIPLKDTSAICRLAQKSYDQKVIKAIRAEQDAANDYLSRVISQTPETIYKKLSRERQKLVCPIEQPDDEYIAEWLSEEYAGSSYDCTNLGLITKKGEYVRSKTELIIANELFDRGIPYKYEHPCYLDGFGTVHPDFTILNVRLRKEIIWEHFGMMSDPDYACSNINKINFYTMNGYYQGDTFIATFEHFMQPLPVKAIAMMIEKYCL